MHVASLLKSVCLYMAVFAGSCAQVVADFVSDQDVALLTGGKHAAKDAARKSRKRQAAWLDRGLPDTKQKDWQPVKCARTASYRFLQHLDHQLVLAIGKGLDQFAVAKDDAACGAA